MMKLFERHPTREAPDSRPETHEDLPQLPEDVTVPDDISDLKLPVPVKPTHRPTTVRWLRWVPVGLVVAAGGVALAVIVSDGGTDTVDPVVPNEAVQEANTPWPASQGPGSNSLNATTPAVTPWPAGEGPGSSSLNATTPVVVTPWEAGDGPGSNSLNATTP